jgi:hypothetical protein
MDALYVLPSAVALAEWLLACLLYALGWYRAKYVLNRVGDSLAVAGLATALANVAWLAWELSPSLASRPAGLALTKSSLATGLAASAVVVYAVLAHRRTERLSAFMVLGLGVLFQAYAVGRLWWGVESVPPALFLPGWAAVRLLTGLVGYAGLVVVATCTILSFTLSSLKGRLDADQLSAGIGLWTLQWRSLQIALVAVTASLSVGLIYAWWGLGQVMADGLAWALIIWLLLAAGAYGLLQGAAPSRLARVLLVLAGVVACATIVS